jgi:hypothetical protein
MKNKTFLLFIASIGAATSLGCISHPRSSLQSAESAQLKPPNAMLQTNSSAQQLTQIQQRLNIPNSFVLVNQQSVLMDGEPIRHLRYERADQQNRNLSGEHISAVISEKDDRLKGFTQMDEQLSKGELPDQEQARKAAITYLQKHAPDLINTMEVRWIKPHEERIQVRSEAGQPQSVTITGMKVKCYNPTDGRYFWVIVGAQAQIITFERDIVWSTDMGRRQTEKWLHDTWLAEQRQAQ